MTPPHDTSRPCPSCGTPMPGPQRYCLHCGERAAAPLVDYAVAWGGATDDTPDPTDPDGATPPGPDEDDGAATGLRGRLERLPRAFGPIAAAVVLLLGVAIGTLASAGAGSSSASAANRGLLFLGGRGAAPTATTPAVAAADDAVDDTTDDEVVPDDTAVAAVPVAPVAAVTDDTSTDTSSDDPGDDTSGGDDLGGDTGDDPQDDASDALTNVWVITLANRPDWFADASPAPYLATDLAVKGAVLGGYTPVATGSLPAGAALLSGQGPTDATPQDCPTYADVTPATLTSGLATGQGCVYPAKVKTLADQIAKAGQTWRAYVEGQGATGCRRPALGQPDPWRDPAAADGFLTARDPFVYFHSIVDSPACATNVADASTFATDIARSGAVPAFSWIVPNTHHDGRDQTVDGVVAPGGPAAETFLRDVVPKIMATDAYKAGGLIAIVPDGPAPTPVDPATPATPGTAATAPAATGALLLSPLVQKGAATTTTTGPYALLRTIEDRMSLAHLGHAADADVATLGDDVFTTQTSEALR